METPVTDEFPCEKCGKRFSTKGRLTFHMRTHYGGKFLRRGPLFQCEKCGKVFPLKIRLIFHMKTHEKSFKCSECKNSYTTEESLVNHMRLHTGEKPYQCDQCEKSYRVKPLLDQHILTHSREKSFHCQECEKRFWKEKHLVVHMRTHTEVRPYQCDQCEKRYKTKVSLDYHILSHTETKTVEATQHETSLEQKGCMDGLMPTRRRGARKRYKCEHCDKSFKFQYHLFVHRQAQTCERAIRCEKCSRDFEHKSDLKIHMKKMHSDKYHKCVLCAESFPKKCHLIRHMKTHTEEPWQCKECGDMFERKKLLNSHMKKHSGKKTYSCGYCGKKYTYKSSYRDHVKAHEKNKYVCNAKWSEKHCKRENDLTQHRSVEHVKVRLISCDQCEFKFVSKPALFKHVRIAHRGGVPIQYLVSSEKDDFSLENPGTILLHYLQNFDFEYNFPLFLWSPCLKEVTAKVPYPTHSIPQVDYCVLEEIPGLSVNQIDDMFRIKFTV